MPRRTTDYRGLAETSRVRLLGAIQQHPGSTLKELADATGLHINTARDHLHALVDEGLVTTATISTNRRGRPPLAYSPVVDASTNPAASRRVAHSRETTARLNLVLHTPGGKTTLGREAAQQLDLLYEHLSDTGLEPEASEDVLEVKLAPCPFFRLAYEEPEFTCGVHRRLLRDTLAQVDGPIDVAELEPFTSPDACRLRLRVTR